MAVSQYETCVYLWDLSATPIEDSLMSTFVTLVELAAS